MRTGKRISCGLIPIIQANTGGPCSSKLPHKWMGSMWRASVGVATYPMATGENSGATTGITTGCSMVPACKSVDKQWCEDSCASE